MNILSSVNFPDYQASKWLNFVLVCETVELESMWNEIHTLVETYEIRPLGQVVEVEKKSITWQNFLQYYTNYLSELKSQQSPLLSEWGMKFNVGLSFEHDCFYEHKVNNHQLINKLIKPVIQIKPHLFTFDKEQRKIFSMSYGKEAVLWGIQFTYPQLYFDKDQQQIIKIWKDRTYKNTLCFSLWQRWLRKHTIPLKVKYQGQVINTLTRVGKKSLSSWVPQAFLLKTLSLEAMF